MRSIWSVLALGLTVSAATVPRPLQPNKVRAAEPAATTFCALIWPGPALKAATAGTPVTGLELGRSISGYDLAILESKGFETKLDTSGGGLGFFYNCHYWYLNIGESDYSYKPLAFDFDIRTSTNWSTSGAFLTALATSEYAETSTFLACSESGQYVLYLQTGSDVPSGVTCYSTTLTA